MRHLEETTGAEQPWYSIASTTIGYLGRTFSSKEIRRTPQSGEVSNCIQEGLTLESQRVWVASDRGTVGAVTLRFFDAANLESSGAMRRLLLLS